MRVATTVLLIRHAHTTAIGYRLVGRMPGVPLTAEGRAQALRLPMRLRGQDFSAVYSSPLERALETARPLAEARDLTVRPCDALVEVDFGEWSGLTFHELDRLPAWRRFNEHRSNAEVPGGERALEVQTRIVGAIDRLGERYPGATVAAVTHADVIRAAVLHVLGAPLDFYGRVDISPASITAVRVGGHAPELLYVNDRDR